LKVDPKQRCGALLFYDTKLAIIPFKEETEDFEDFLDGYFVIMLMFDQKRKGEC
jgi:hypothetical protein